MNISKLNDLETVIIGKSKDKFAPSELFRSEEADQEFNSLLKKQLDEKASEKVDNYGIELSNHAAKRLKERNLLMDGNEFFKIREAIDKIRNKGGKDSLVVTNNAAYIVDVQNDKIVTALNKDNMSENVFTKIDSTLFVN